MINLTLGEIMVAYFTKNYLSEKVYCRPTVEQKSIFM